MSLNRNQIKYLVILAMVIDHVAWSFVPTASATGQLMHFVGRLTGPTMAYFLYEGYLHTRDVKRYALRLAAFALISWPAYDLLFHGAWPRPELDVMYTLLLGLLALWLWDKSRLPRGVKILLVGLLCLLSMFGDWLVFDVLYPLLLFINREEENKKWRAFFHVSLGAFAASAFGASPWWAGAYNLGVFLPCLLLRFCYNGEPGSQSPFHKWFFYLFYPAHMLALYAIKTYL